jgi:hypothetical protein
MRISCDRCGISAEAKYVVKLIEGELAFCGHHYNKYKEGLDKIAFEVVELATQPELVEAEV